MDHEDTGARDGEGGCLWGGLLARMAAAAVSLVPPV
jgi:hypothetical protein